MRYFAYILKSGKDGSLYNIGLTSNIKKRMKEHYSGVSGFTKGHFPYKLLFVSMFTDKKIATRFEKYLKTASGKTLINKRLIR